jgi:hypothetical protein
MTGFDERLRSAIERGAQRAHSAADAARKAALSEEELRQLHTQCRLRLSERIESEVRRLPDFFPGFRLHTLYGEQGWGVACSRDDFASGRGGDRQNEFSRFELTVRPFSPTLAVLELSGKATIRNREIFNRTHFEKLDEADVERFEQLIDVWILEFAERFAAS